MCVLFFSPCLFTSSLSGCLQTYIHPSFGIRRVPATPGLSTRGGQIPEALFGVQSHGSWLFLFFFPSSFKNNLLCRSRLPFHPQLQVALSKHAAVEVLQDVVPHQAWGERQRLDGAQPHRVKGHPSGGSLFLSGFGRKRACRGPGERKHWRCPFDSMLSPRSEWLKCNTGVFWWQHYETFCSYAFVLMLPCEAIALFSESWDAASSLTGYVGKWFLEWL